MYTDVQTVILHDISAVLVFTHPAAFKIIHCADVVSISGTASNGHGLLTLDEHGWCNVTVC